MRLTSYSQNVILTAIDTLMKLYVSPAMKGYEDLSEARRWVAAQTDKPSLVDVLEEAAQWRKQTFPNESVKGVMAHLKEEALELADNICFEEIADVVLLSDAAVTALGGSLADIVGRKLQINKNRRWDELGEDGVVRHVKEEQELVDEIAHLRESFLKLVNPQVVDVAGMMGDPLMVVYEVNHYLNSLYKVRAHLSLISGEKFDEE